MSEADLGEIAALPSLNRIIVTGSAGFIGHWLCERLVAEGYSVLGIDAKATDGQVPWEQQQIDLLDQPRLAQAFDDFQPEALVHLAARTDLIGETISDYEVNRKGVHNLCDLVATTPTVRRAIYTSSQLVCKVGHVPKTDTDYAPTTVYGESKVATEQIVRSSDGGGVPWCLTRPTTVWGPGMSAHYAMVMKMVDRGIFFHSGKGALYKSYSYAENIAHQYLQLILAPEASIHGKVFYLADYEAFSLRDYVNKIADEMGKRRPITLPLPVARGLALIGDGLNGLRIRFPFNTFRLNNIRTEYIFDLSETEKVCGPVPVSFDEGVRRTVAWYRSGSKGRGKGT